MPPVMPSALIENAEAQAQGAVRIGEQPLFQVIQHAARVKRINPGISRLFIMAECLAWVDIGAFDGRMRYAVFLGIAFSSSTISPLSMA